MVWFALTERLTPSERREWALLLNPSDVPELAQTPNADVMAQMLEMGAFDG